MASSTEVLLGGSALVPTSSGGCGRPALPVHKPADAAGLPLAGNELLFVTQRDEPALAAQCAHLADMIDVHQGVSVDALKAGISQALVQHLERLRRLVFLARGGDPDDVALGMECENLQVGRAHV